MRPRPGIECLRCVKTEYKNFGVDEIGNLTVRIAFAIRGVEPVGKSFLCKRGRPQLQDRGIQGGGVGQIGWCFQACRESNGSSLRSSNPAVS